MKNRYIDLTGMRFGRLVVIETCEQKTKSTSKRWVCKCDCGNLKEIDSQPLLNGVTVSCGCYSREINSARIKHGHNRKNKPKTPTYKSWDKMMTRCRNHNCKEYKYYGGRGIKVCERWSDFSNFLQDMGERPNGKTLDRIDNNGDYEPSNCKWATDKQQANNNRRNVRYLYNGEMKTIAELSDILGISYDTLWCRLKRYKWSLENSLTKPVSKSNIGKGY